MCDLLKRLCLRSDSVKKDTLSQDQKNDFKSTPLEVPLIKNPIEDSDVQPRVVIHHGISTCSAIAYDPLQHALALATRDGQVKVFSTTGSETLLQPSKASSIRFLQFFNNQALLVTVNGENTIEIWSISKAELLCSRKWDSVVTALAVIQDSNFLYIGDKTGAVTVVQYDHNSKDLNVVPYILKVSQILGDFAENYDEKSVTEVLPQPSGEYEKVLLCYANGICILWALHDGQVVAVRSHIQSQIEAIVEAEKGQTNTQTSSSELKVVIDEDDVRNLMTVCWCCSKGTVFATGYTNGEIWLWIIPSKLKTEDKENIYAKFSSSPICKLSGGCMIHLSTLRWWEDNSGGKRESNGYLCALGGRSFSTCDMLKVISLKSKSSVDLVVPGDLADCYVIDTPSKIQLIVVAAKSGHSLYVYNLKEVYRSFKEESKVRPVSVVFPLLESRITAAKTILLNRNGSVANHLMELPRLLSSYLGYKSSEVDEKCLLNGCTNAEVFPDSKDNGCYLYVTGHENGSVHLWDMSNQVSLIKTQECKGSKSPKSQAAVEVCCLDFCYASGFLAIGFQNGLISLYKLHFVVKNSITEGDWRFVSDIAEHTVPLSRILISNACQCIVAGNECGIILLFHLETNMILYEGRCHPNMTSEIMSFNFLSLSTQITLPCCASPSTTGSKAQQLKVQTENLLIVATKEPQIFILDAKSGGCGSTSPLKLKTQSKAISLHILDTAGDSLMMASGYQSRFVPETSVQEPRNFSAEPCKCLILLCTEDALLVYYLSSLLKGIYSSSMRKELGGSCSWASTFQTPSNRTGLVLMYKSNMIEVRGFPKLDILKSISLDNVLHRKMESSLGLVRAISCTSNGQIALVQDDNELFVLSLVHAKHEIRFSTLPLPQVSENSSELDAEKKKKKMSIGKILKANAFSKPRDKANESQHYRVLELEQLFTGTSSSHQSFLNSNDGSRSLEIGGNDLDIDDIVIDEGGGAATSSRTNLIMKLKKKIRNNKGEKQSKQRIQSSKNEAQSDLSTGLAARTIDEIKATYGQGREQNVTGTAAGMRDKLLEQRQKIQAIDKRTVEMQEGAENFQLLAEELVKTIQEKNKRIF